MKLPPILMALLFLCGCSAKIDRKAYRVYKKEYREVPALMFGYGDGTMYQTYFALRENQGFSYVSYSFGAKTVYLGEWQINETNDTIFFTSISDQKLADYALIKYPELYYQLRALGDSTISPHKMGWIEFYNDGNRSRTLSITKNDLKDTY
jgi:hypothetical protein